MPLYDPIMQMKFVALCLVLLLAVGCQTHAPTQAREDSRTYPDQAEKEFVISGWVENPGLYLRPTSNSITVADLVGVAGRLTHTGYAHTAVLKNTKTTRRATVQDGQWNTPLTKMGIDIADFDQLEIRRRLWP